MMAIYTDPINGGCACAREKCNNTCETYANRTIPGRTTNYTVTRDEITVTPNGEVAIVRRDMQTDKVTMIPPHGRLWDLDELYSRLERWYQTYERAFSESEVIYIRAMLAGVKETPTIIPADKG